MSLTFKVPVTGTEIETEKRDQVLVPLKWGFLGSVSGFVGMVAWHAVTPVTLGLLESIPGFLYATIGVGAAAAVASSVIYNCNIPVAVAKDGAKLVKDKTIEYSNQGVGLIDSVLPAYSDKYLERQRLAAEKQKQKPQEQAKAPAAITPAKQIAASRSQDDEPRQGGNVYNNCTFYGRDEEPRGREQAKSTAASRGKTPTRKSGRSPARKKH